MDIQNNRGVNKIVQLSHVSVQECSPGWYGGATTSEDIDFFYLVNSSKILHIQLLPLGPK